MLRRHKTFTGKMLDVCRNWWGRCEGFDEHFCTSFHGQFETWAQNHKRNAIFYTFQHVPDHTLWEGGEGGIGIDRDSVNFCLFPREKSINFTLEIQKNSLLLAGWMERGERQSWSFSPTRCAAIFRYQFQISIQLPLNLLCIESTIIEWTDKNSQE